MENRELTKAEEAYYVVGGSVEAAADINDAIVSAYVEDVTKDNVIPAVNAIAMHQIDFNGIVSRVGTEPEVEEETEDTYTPVENPTGNPSEQGWYVKNGDVYELTVDTEVQVGTTYYTKD
jgi:hypothetical protein